MMKYFKYTICFYFLFFFFESRAGLYGWNGSNARLRPEELLFIKDFFKNNLLLSLFNLFYLIPFSIWVKKQPISSEILLYQIRGKFTLFNLKLWIEKIENKRGLRLNKLRKRVQLYANTSRDKNLNIRYYKSVITREILKNSFGKKRREVAFKRMHKNTKLLIIGQLSQVVASTILAIKFWIIDLNSFLSGFFLGIATALFMGAVYWLIINYIFSQIINFCIQIIKKKNGHAGYWHIISAELRGFYGVFWPNIPIPKKALMLMTNLFVEDGKSEILFNDFKGGGAAGDW